METTRQAGHRRGPFTRWPRTTDALLGLFVAVSTLFVVASPDEGDLRIDAIGDLPWFAYVLLAVAAGAVFWRRSHPLPVVVAEAVVVPVWGLLEYDGDPSLGLIIAVYSVGRYVSSIRHSYGVIATIVAFASIIVYFDLRDLPQTGLVVVMTWLPWYIGRRILVRHEYLAMLEERAVHLERERTALAERAVAQERDDIARELHDVVAHRVSMMTVQAGAANTIGADNPEDALKAVAAIEQEGRLALTELRHLLGVLRTDGGGDAGTSPQGAMAQVSDVVDRMRDAGYDVAFRSSVDAASIPSRVSLSIYRIVQEALTNVVKHTGNGTKVEVEIKSRDGKLEVVVLDNGTALSPLPRSGFGLAGMKERVSLLGGTLDVGPRPGGGWMVRARIPMEDWA